MPDEIVLTPEQVAWGVYVQDHIDAFGSCTCLSCDTRDVFRDNIGGLRWMCSHNEWNLKYDSVLDVTTITGGVNGCLGMNSIRAIHRRVKKPKKVKK